MRQNLDQTLGDLHSQLSEVENLQPEEIEMLRKAVAEIQATLDDKEVNTASIAERLKEATQQLEASHPVLTGTIGRVAELLSQIGI